MKILLIVNTDGALFIFRKPLISYLKKSNHDVESISGRSDFFHRLIELGVGVHELDFSRHSVSLLQNLRLLFSLKYLIQKISPDIVHNFTHKPSIYGSLAARLAGVKRIFVTITGLGTLFIHDDLKSRILREILVIQYRLALRFVNTVFFQNPDDLSYFLQRRIVLPKQVLLTNGSGIDLDEIGSYSEERRIRARATLAAELEKNIGLRQVVLVPARAMREKGYYEYYEAAKILSSRYPSRFVFLHLGWVESSLKGGVSKDTILAYAQQHGVCYLGFKDNISEYMLASDIIVLPSYREGTPRSLIEALALGRVIVTTNVPGCRETVVDGWNGYLCEPKSAKSLASKIEMVDQDFSTLAINRSRKLCEDKYDVNKLIKITAERYGI